MKSQRGGAHNDQSAGKIQRLLQPHNRGTHSRPSDGQLESGHRHDCLERGRRKGILYRWGSAPPRWRRYDGRGTIGIPLEELHSVIRDVPKSVIARVQGYAIGGVNVLALLCDLTIASERAVFGQVGSPQGRIGGSGMGGPLFWPGRSARRRPGKYGISVGAIRRQRLWQWGCATSLCPMISSMRKSTSGAPRSLTRVRWPLPLPSVHSVPTRSIPVESVPLVCRPFPCITGPLNPGHGCRHSLKNACSPFSTGENDPSPPCRRRRGNRCQRSGSRLTLGQGHESAASAAFDTVHHGC
ncbi:MAG: 2-ketocyclohexanecarboxyl-CoA hydrolase [Rhodospirillaceae bacterium]|nr:MAG: 2-ketocyclohexanecarboxyl-CoA hydrolase [Rhodospirillaceae bacterium]